MLFFVVIAALGCKGKQSDKATEGSAAGTTYTPEQAAKRAGPGFMPVKRLAAKIIYTRTEISVDGETVIEIKPDGLISPDQFGRLVQRIEDKATGDDPIGILLDPSLPYSQAGVLIGALNVAGFYKLALLAGVGSAMVPLDMIDQQVANAGSLRPMLTVQSGSISLWSVSGKEGTKQRPKLTFQITATNSFAPISKALAEIVQRNWPVDTRSPEDKTIVLFIDGATTADVLIRLCAAVRTDGPHELFPNIYLAGGF